MTPGVLATSYRCRRETSGFIFSSSDRDCPMPPAAPSTATLKPELPPFARVGMAASMLLLACEACVFRRDHTCTHTQTARQKGRGRQPSRHRSATERNALAIRGRKDKDQLVGAIGWSDNMCFRRLPPEEQCARRCARGAPSSAASPTQQGNPGGNGEGGQRLLNSRSTPPFPRRLREEVQRPKSPCHSSLPTEDEGSRQRWYLRSLASKDGFGASYFQNCAAAEERCRNGGRELEQA